MSDVSINSVIMPSTAYELMDLTGRICCLLLILKNMNSTNCHFVVAEKINLKWLIFIKTITRKFVVTKRICNSLPDQPHYLCCTPRKGCSQPLMRIISIIIHTSTILGEERPPCLWDYKGTFLNSFKMFKSVNDCLKIKERSPCSI